MSGLRFRSACAAAALAAAPTLHAQTIVSPPNFAVAEAPSYGWGGIGTTATPSVLQTVHDGFAGTARTFRGVSFRRDGVVNTATYAPASMLVSVFMSTAATTAATASDTFAQNHGANKKAVAQFSLVQLPASSFKGLNAPFEFHIPFASPFSYSGTGSVCLEIQVQSRTQTQLYYLDFVPGGQANPPLETISKGSGCKVAGANSAIVLQPSYTSNWPGNSVTFRYSGYNLAPNSLVTVGIGISDQVYAGLPLPAALPGTSSAPSGTCTIYNDYLLQIPALSDANGQMNLNLGSTASPAQNGVNLYAQLITLSAGANAYGLSMSNGVQHQIVAPYAAPTTATIYADGTLGPTGTLLKGQSYVMRFDV